MAPHNDLSRAQWRKSRRSNGGEACVELTGIRGLVAVRDSKDSGGPTLAFAPGAWREFADRMKNGELDL